MNNHMHFILIFLILLGVAVYLVACAPPSDQFVTITTSNVQPVLSAPGIDLYKYEDASTNIVCYVTDSDLECFQR